ncbi:MAG: ParB/RepB/Spo0J family partition protein [Pseudomonadota bacterium]
MQQRKALGKGLESLISTIQKPKAENGLNFMNIDQIVPSSLQPREYFDEEKIKELSDSIKENGIIQPLIVSKLPEGRFELVAGERRLRAARKAGMNEVPVIIRDLEPRKHLEISIIENIQREDLNAIEEAKAYQDLMDKFEISHEDVAIKVGKSRSAVSNSLRLLKLPKILQEDVMRGDISAGHARALLTVKSIQEQLSLREQILEKRITVRDIESMAKSTTENKNKKVKSNQKLTAQLTQVVNDLRLSLGTQVKISPKGVGGKMTIDFYSKEDLDRIYKLLTA